MYGDRRSNPNIPEQPGRIVRGTYEDLGAACVGEAERIPEIPGELGELNRNTEKLEQVCEMLYSRLHPVLRDSTQTTNPSPPQQSTETAIGGGIREQSNRVANIATALNDILTRLEV